MTTAAVAAVPASPAAGMTTRVLRGSAWGMSGQVISAAAAFVATPIVLRQLGTEAYGVYALVNMVAGYVAFADLGTGEASTRFAAAAHERGDDRGEAAVLWTTLVIAFAASGAAAAAVMLAAGPLVRTVFHLPPALQPVAITALRIAAVGFVARAVAGVLNTPQLVRLRLDLCTAINSGSSVLQIVLVPCVLALGGGLTGAVWVIAGAGIAMAIGHAVAASRLLPGLGHPRVDMALMPAVVRFGLAVAASALLSIPLGSGERIMLTWLGNVSMLAHYSVAATFVGLMSMAPVAMGQVLLPAFARLGSLEDRAALHQLYERALRATLLWSTPAAVLLCAGARPFFTLWAGPEYGVASTPIFYVLAPGLWLNMIAFVPYRVLVAQGRTPFIARYHAIELIPYLVLTAALTVSFGARGAAAAWTLRQAAGVIVLAIAASRLERLELPHHSPGARAFAGAAMALVIPVGVVIAVADSPVIVAAVVAAALIIYMMLAWGSVLSADERGSLLQMLRRTPAGERQIP